MLPGESGPSLEFGARCGGCLFRLINNRAYPGEAVQNGVAQDLGFVNWKPKAGDHGATSRLIRDLLK